jgi:uncharacterized protein YcbX
VRVTELWVYPVKSLGGVSPTEADVEPWGLRGDRRLAVIEPDGTKVNAQRVPSLLGLVAETFGSGRVRITDRAGGTLEVGPSRTGEVVAVDHSRQGTAVAVGAEADRWLSARVGRAVRLVWQPDPTVRSISPAHGGLPGESLSLADAAPLLLVSQASLRQLDTWIAADEPAAEPLSQRRFRGNVVIDADDPDALAPFAEENWATVSLGGVEFRRTRVCDRCSTTMIDPVTLATGKEPIRTLAGRRRREGKTWYGIRLAPLGTGTVRVGDRVVPGEPGSPGA